MKLSVSIAQIQVAAAKPQDNLAKSERLIAEAAQRKSDLICFPEMWTTGFNWAYNERIAQEHEKVIAQVAEMAKRHNIWINGSLLALNDEGKVSNTSILFDAKGGRVGVYRKAHLFSFIHEDKHMAPGNSLCLTDTPWGLIGQSICYDLRFPEFFRALALKGAKVVLSPMAFPYPKLHHWKALVRARAIENQMFMIGVNQIGSEDFGADGMVTYCGDSVIIDPWGEAIVEASENKEELLTATIEVGKVDEVRSKMHVFADRRPDLYDLQ